MSGQTFKGRTALITGSTSGIGAAIAEKLAASGANIILNGFGDADAIEAQRAELEQRYGVKAAFVAADLTKGAEATKLVHDAERAIAPVDILVNNAGIQHVAPVAEFPPEKWEALIAICLSSAFYTSAAALPHMKRQDWGRIINIASAQGKVASAYKSAYNAAKHGVIGFTKSVALEYAESGVTANCICPGYVNTPLVQGQVAGQAKAHNMSEEDVIRNVILSVQPNKRFVEPEEIGDMAVYLASDSARSITGAAISVDGAWTAW
ncbi:3-hydroxybutyrate dehydrogenase [Pacificimonas sp. WHA3]|uniref:3-hydroxybutyrate dehydrogenase n=1 Tax=Pacificimonas pallii TaxID=2827236 RepID=A0ABS6SGQ5_9SPHN|nr:3-hydroxybutyrate dehydrogenase [Pacificimonas pallii]MBV7257096.1 3-hydroxybutyrate dehydrogenase [Pacificimonas pallii]